MVNIKVINIGAQFQNKQIRDVEKVPPVRAAHKNILLHSELANTHQPTPSWQLAVFPFLGAQSSFSGKNTSHK